MDLFSKIKKLLQNNKSIDHIVLNDSSDDFIKTMQQRLPLYESNKDGELITQKEYNALPYRKQTEYKRIQ